MKLRLVLALCAATFLAGCSKCSQQPTTEAPPVEAAQDMPEVGTEATVEGETSESLPNSDQMNEELPSGEGDAEGK